MNILEKHAFVSTAQIDTEVKWDREFVKYLRKGLWDVFQHDAPFDEICIITQWSAFLFVGQ